MPFLQQFEASGPGECDMNSIAVIGLSCRFPGDASNADNFWDLLCKGRSTYTKIPKSRFNVDAFYGHTKGKQNTIITKGGHFIAQDISAFDAAFFSINKTEAQAFDPQQRMVMEVTYEALENAGLPIEKVAGTQTGCFVGSFTNDYREMLFRDTQTAPTYAATGSGSELLSNRLSWFYDLRGPSMTIGTACSSSLVAVHQACQSLRIGECKMAIAGGVNLLLNPDMFMFLSNQQFLTPDGLCKSFDQEGNGYSRGEGIAAVILKPINDALRDGDCIRAVIRGTGVNQDGKTKGITLPSAEAQAELIRKTYASAGLDFRDTNYFEAHGTGTRAGDPLEARAIAQTLSATRQKGTNLIVGSVKSNIGHLEACAGLAGLIKGIYILESGLIPANLHFKTGNMEIPFEEWKIEVPREQRSWPTIGIRRLSVNSFGYGGTNAHAILDDAYHYLNERGLRGNHNTIVKPGLSLRRVAKSINGFHLSGNDFIVKSNGTKSSERSRLFVFSSHDEDGLNRLRSTYSAHFFDRLLASKGDISGADAYLRDLAYTLSTKRSCLPWRMALVASSMEELIQGLSGTSEGISFRPTREPRLGFVFTGQGAQWAKMGFGLCHYQVFRDSVEEADRYLTSTLGCRWSALQELHREESESNINLPEYSQTLCTVLQVALVDLLKSWNITPDAVVGHSSGEIGAAYCLGALSREDAWKIAYFRGTLSSKIRIIAPELRGAMLAAGCSERAARVWISKVTLGEVVVACVNSPHSVTISGDAAAIDELDALLKADKIFSRKLKVETAYHSSHMSIIASQYLQEIIDVEPRSPSTNRKMYSSVTGNLISLSELGPANWVRNLLSPVLFSEAVHDLLRPRQAKGQRATENAVDILVEIGPHSALQGPLNQIMKEYSITGVTYQSVLSRKKDAARTSLVCVGALVTHGSRVRFSHVNNDAGDAFSRSAKPIVNLPPYSWNHSRTFWSESRITKQYRLQQFPRTGLIGAPCPIINEAERVWRGMIRVSEEPWLSDHKIQSSILYPAAGFIAMAIEGAFQMAEANRTIRDFKLRDIRITSAMVLTEDRDVECILQIRPHLIGTRDGGSFGWLEFTVSSSADGQELRQNCSGLLLIDYQSPPESNTRYECELEDQASKDLFHRAEISCQVSEDPNRFYEELSSLGLDYGPLFRNVTEIRQGIQQSCCSVTIPDTELRGIHGNSTRPHIIHPATLDAMFHAAFAALKSGKGRLKTAMVPKSIDEVIISSEISFAPTSQFRGFSAASRHGFKEIMADIQMLQGPLETPAVRIKGFCCAEISSMSKSTVDRSDGAAKMLCSKMVWKPAVEFLSSKQMRELIHTTELDYLSAESVALIEKSDMLALQFIRRALKRVSIDEITAPRWQNLYRWMQEQERQSQRPLAQCLRPEDAPWFHMGDGMNEQVQAEIAASGVEGEVLCTVGSVLDQILQGKVDPEEQLITKELQDGFLASVTGMSECRSKLTNLIEKMAHTNPTLNILELGIGTGNIALSILSLPHSDLFNYTISCTDTTILEKNKAMLQNYRTSMEYKLFNVNKDLAYQGLEENSFDVIIASNGLTTAQNMDKALINAHKLLKAGGTLCLIEVAHPGLRLGLVLGCLNRCQRKHNGQSFENLGAQGWVSALKRNGFVPDLISADFENPRYSQISLIVATAPVPDVREATRLTHEVIILESRSPSVVSQELAAQLAFEMEKLSVKATKLRWTADPSIWDGKHCIALIEVESSFLEDVIEQDYTAMKQLILQTSSLLWITAQDAPTKGLMTGMARSIRNEIASLQFRTLQVSPGSLKAPGQLASLVAKLALTSVPDNEFVEEDGVLKVSRAEEDAALNEKVSSLLDDGKIERIPLVQANGPQKLSVQSPGMLDSLCFEADELAGTSLADDEVEIEVKATGLNFRDVMVAMGQIPDSLLGFEASGIITRTGFFVTAFAPGDPVCTVGQGAHRTLFRNKAIFCQHIPDGVSFEAAATLPLVHCTAYHALVKIARVQKGQSILIHAAAGGVGQAAIQLAQHFGLEIFATVGSPDKRALITELYGILDSHIFNSRDLSFQKGLMRMTNGRGVDCVLNSLSGEALRQSWYCVAPFGTFVEIGIKDILGNTRLDMRPFLQDAQFAFLNLEHVARRRPEVMAEIMEGTFNFLRKGVTRPVKPLAVYSVADVESAFRLMQTGRHRGKIAMSFKEGDVVPVLRRATDVLKLDGYATYVLVGGLGGLGRSLSNLLVKHGARNLCFISRNGANSSKAKKQIRDLETGGVQIRVYCCDVASMESLKETLRHCSTELPPVKGVIQCAMVLRDGLFENLSYQDWNESTRPKVQGSWNLHSLLPEALDFFVILSSFAGVFGNRGQSNYAAAGAYQDALAHFRRSKGLKAITVDLGIMRDVGVIAEKGATGDLQEWEQPFGIRELEFHALLTGVLADQLKGTGELPPQIMTGLATGGLAKAAGIRPPFYFDDARFSILRSSGLQNQKETAVADGTLPLSAKIAQAKSLGDASKVVTSAVMAKVAKSLQTAESEIDAGKPLHFYGVDSLVAVEIRNWVFKEIKAEITVFDILSAIPITALAAGIAAKSKLLPDGIVDQ